MNSINLRCNRAWIAALLASLAFGSSQEALCQLTRVTPGASYYAAMEELYGAEYRNATRGFQSEINGAVRTVQDRWLDSICYFTMMGETLYQVGDYPAALEHFDRAILLFLDSPDWLKQISFRVGPQVDNNRNRRIPDWARSARPVVYADLPTTYLVAIGRVDNSQLAETGGIVQQAQYWKLNAEEVSRSIAWSIYRRGYLLGPLAKHDDLQKRLATRLARGSLTQAGHWSEAWVELWWGLAAGSVGDLKGAMPHLQRATLLGNQYQHSLTGLALLAQGSLTLGSPEAGSLLRESLSAAVAYEDFSVMGEASQQITVQLAVSPGSVTPVGFATGANWLRRSGFDHTAAELDLQAIEQLINRNEFRAAVTRLGTLYGRRSEAKQGRLASYGTFLAARTHALNGDVEEATRQLKSASKQHYGYSLRSFQVQLVNNRLDEGVISARLADEIYRILLGDPHPLAWASDPLDVMVMLRTDMHDAFDRWFRSVQSRQEKLGLFEIVDLQRRRAFYRAQDYAGRRINMRLLLEQPKEKLPAKELAERAKLEDRLPLYTEGRQQGNAMRRVIKDKENLFAEKGLTKADRNQLKDYEKTLDIRETQLAQLALSRIPTPLIFPSHFDKASAKNRLAEGEIIYQIHQVEDEFFGLVLAAEGEHSWRIGTENDLNEPIIEFLRETAGNSRDQEWTFDQLESETWKPKAKAVASLLFSKSRIDFANTKKLTIVPDGITWHLPFGVLPVGSDIPHLVKGLPLRLSPTVGHALDHRTERPSVKHVVAIQPRQGDFIAAGKKIDPSLRTKNVFTTDVTPPAVLKGVSDQLITNVDLSLLRGEVLKLDPLPMDRKRNRGVQSWLQLPGRAPNCLVLGALHSEAEMLPKLARRRSADKQTQRLGDEMFQATCSLLAGGSRTLLLTRWVTGGRRHSELVSEFLIGLQQEGASLAWQRSLELAEETPLRIEEEPRVEHPDDDGVTPPSEGEHPFFWAGYLLID